MTTPTIKKRDYNPFLLLSYASLFCLWLGSQYVFIRYEIHFFVLVICILYISCHRSLILLVEEEVTIISGDDDETKVTETKKLVERETLREGDAMQFPLLASASIFSLYLAFKFFDRETVNLIISGYLSVMGGGALSITLSPVLSHFLPILEEKKIGKDIIIPTPSFLHSITGESPLDFSFSISISAIIAFIPCLALSIYQYKRKYWALNNVFGIVFCLQSIERFSLGTYKIGAILLAGLFIYDIFWVFGTEVMVTVAKGVDGPIKILFPKSLTPNPETGKLETSLLGLGDIVIPGFFLALLLRFDAYQCSKDQKISKNIIDASFPKPYFHSCLLSYVLGLVVTNIVMIVFDAAQPALLYLVPACLGSSFLCGFVRGELTELFQYSEEEEENDTEVEKESEKSEKSNDEKNDQDKKQD